MSDDTRGPGELIADGLGGLAIWLKGKDPEGNKADEDDWAAAVQDIANGINLLIAELRQHEVL